MASLHECECRRLGLACGGVEREPHRRQCADRISGQLTRVRDPGVRGETRPQRDHPLEGRERLLVPSQLDERIPDDPVGPPRPRQQQPRLATVRESLPKLVPDEGERAESENRVRLPGLNTQCLLESRLRARQIRRIRGLAPAELVREAELGEETGVAGSSANLRLEPGDAGRRHATRSGERLIGDRPSSQGGSGGGPCGRRLGEDAADERAEGERDRNRASHEQCRPASHAEPPPTSA